MNSSLDNCIPSIDFDPNGEVAGTIDSNGVFLVSDLTPQIYGFHLALGSRNDLF